MHKLQHYSKIFPQKLFCGKIIYRIACNFRGVKISFILKKEIFGSKNFVFRAAVEGGGARLGFSWLKIFVEVSSLTKITKFLPHENYTLYGR